MDVSVGQDCFVRETDFIAILGNAMENAIHGCLNSEKEEKENYEICRVCSCYCDV